jgi:hypothetical protein
MDTDTLLLQISWCLQPIPTPSAESYTGVECTSNDDVHSYHPGGGPGDSYTFILCLPFVLSGLAHFLLEIIHVITLGMFDRQATRRRGIFM